MNPSKNLYRGTHYEPIFNLPGQFLKRSFISAIADSGLLNASTLNSLLHKVKGGALLSQSDDLHQCCSDLERSNQAIAERISLFRQALIDNNLNLENQILQLKKL